jgi:hypothetical protein
MTQLRHPVRAFTTREKLMMIGEALWLPLAMKLHYRRTIPRAMIARGKRRTEWAGPRTAIAEVAKPTVGVP